MSRLCEVARTETRTLKKKEWLVILGYPGLVAVALLASACIPILEKQLLVIAVLVGARLVFLDLNINETKVVIIERSQS